MLRHGPPPSETSSEGCSSRRSPGTLGSVRSLADELSPAGWPRPWLLWTPPAHGIRSQWMPRILPVPWINGVHPYHGDWLTFDETRAVRVNDERLCGVCGQPLDRIALLGRGGDGSTSGPACHPRCMQLTLTACPHFADPDQPTGAAATVGWRVDGRHVGYVGPLEHRTSYEGLRRVSAGLPEVTAHDVRILAGMDPWGTGRRDTIDANDTVDDG